MHLITGNTPVTIIYMSIYLSILLDESMDTLLDSEGVPSTLWPSPQREQSASSGRKSTSVAGTS